MRFDWYQATVHAPADMVLSHLMGAFDSPRASQGKGRHGYRSSWAIEDRHTGHTCCTLLTQGTDANPHPHVIATGESAPILADFLSGQGWRYGVSRLDACEDIQAPWEAIYATAQGIARDSRLKGRSILPDDPADGRTYYIGANSSRARVRIYEKAAELRAKGWPASALPPDDTIRCEVQVRPQGDTKFAAGDLTPEQAWGTTDWTRTLAAVVLRADVPRVNLRQHRESDEQRSFNWMIRQYAPMLAARAARVGWDALLAEIRESVIATQEPGRDAA